MNRVLLLLITLAVGVHLAIAALPPLQTVFVIVLENQNWSAFKGSPDAPYLNSLLPLASHCEQYYNPPGLHPSLPNYLWLEAGTNYGVFDDDTPAVHHQADTNHFVTLLRRAGISWRAYQEGISGLTVPLTDFNGYAVRHNPFAYFDDVTGTNNPGDPYGLAHIRPYAELAGDLASNTVARYNFITPDVCHDGHDSCAPLYNPVRQVDQWLAAEIPAILHSAAYSNNGALFITWDEGAGGDGPIGLIVLSPQARGGGYFNNIHYTHSSLLRTLQSIFGVAPLLNDSASAADLSDLFTTYSITNVELRTNGLRMECIGVVPGQTNIVETSPDLSSWAPVSTNLSVTNVFLFLDPRATNYGQRYYRVRALP